jgi:hypothetical protein
MSNPIRILIVLDDDPTFGIHASFGPTDLFDHWFGLSEVAAEPIEFALTKAHRKDDPQFPNGTMVRPGMEKYVPEKRDFDFDTQCSGPYGGRHFADGR